MADLQNSVTRPLIIVFIQLFSAYRQSATLELLVRNSRWTALLPKRWPICKTQSDASSSSSLACLMMFTSLLSRYGKNVAKPRYEPKDAQFIKKFLHLSESSFWPRFFVLSFIITFYSSYVKILVEPNCGQKDGQFIKHWHTSLNDRFQLVLPQGFKSSFSFSYLVLSIIVTLWSFYGEIVAEPCYCPRNNQFPKHCQTPPNNRF